MTNKIDLNITEQTNTKTPTRLFHLDNLRIYLTILVILHHTAIAYGGAGDWAIVVVLISGAKNLSRKHERIMIQDA